MSGRVLRIHVHLLLIHSNNPKVHCLVGMSCQSFKCTCASKERTSSQLKEMTRYPRPKHYSALGECTLDAVKLEYLVAMFFCNI